LDSSGAEQLRESETAVCHAGSTVQSRLVRDRGDRRGSRPIGVGYSDQSRLRAYGCGSMFRAGRRSAAREVSRFARNSREWQKLVEVCRVVDTLLFDQEMVYTPRQSNDRLLLGLKGSLNEYQLDLLRQRTVEAGA